MKNNLFLVLVILFCFSSNQLFSQGARVIEHEGISDVMNKYREQNNESEYIRGWRIQIITTDDRRKMENAKAKFQAMYPDINTKWEHKAPFYVVKVGAFQDKRAFQGFLLEIKQNFPTAIPIIENIRKEDLVR